ncbi:MAG: anaerobic sulfatase maturase [Candidatus Aminicenantes bacterium]|nr:MAG: anaerobic sulfatase maturase [Candidatus Aminicenantes bacterium]
MIGNKEKNLQAFHVMAKPTGAQCNLECDYCFFLKKDQLYPDSDFRMSDETMEAYIRQTIEGHHVPEVTIAWQGGEPTLMGLDFFRRSVEMEKKYSKPGMRIENTLQTNGVLIDEEWCKFFHENNFLIGLSLDGPRHLHDVYRHDKGGKSVFDKVLRAARLMQKHDVEFNILCTVNAKNSQHPLDVYRFFRDELEARYIQFIPIVERDNETGNQEGTQITDRTVDPEQYGRFLIAIFDEWVRQDVGFMFVQFFDGVLASYVRGRSTLCILTPTCGEGVALEHNGDLYSCDHFVEPRCLLGNISQTSIPDLVSSDAQLTFGQAKSETLPKYCQECKFRFTCHGECPKNRVLTTPDGEPGLNWLCVGLKAFFEHVDRPMQIMADLLRRGQYADGIIKILAQEEGRSVPKEEKVGRNDPCPCGSGRKYKKCHGA